MKLVNRKDFLFAALLLLFGVAYATGGLSSLLSVLSAGFGTWMGSRHGSSRKGPAQAEQPPDLAHPPRGAEYLLYLFLSRQQREPLLGDLEELFHEVAEKFGPRWATVLCYVEVGKSLAPILAGWARRLVKWGVVAGLGDLLRRCGIPWLADLLHKIAR